MFLRKIACVFTLRKPDFDCRFALVFAFASGYIELSKRQYCSFDSLWQI
nr:MAG TPA: hypothetical protein [Caudoviricetes sp.]